MADPRTTHDDDVERLRRALYRPDPDDLALAAYLDRRGAPAAQPAPAVRSAPRPRHPIGLGSLACALLVAVAVLLPAPAGSAPVYRLPVPPAGDFSAAFAVPGAAPAGGSLWRALADTTIFAPGVEVAAGRGSGHVFALVSAPGVARSGDGPLTIFVACSTGTADVLLTTVAQDFDTGYQVPFASARVPCGGVRALRYTRPAGLVPNAVSVAARRDVVVSVVGGL